MHIIIALVTAPLIPARRRFAPALAPALAAALAAAAGMLGGCSPQFILAHGINSARSPVEATAEYRTLNPQQQDVLYLAKFLEESYPTPVDRIYPGGGFLAARDQLIGELAVPVAAEEFDLRLARFVSGVSSEHTWVSRPDAGGSAPYFPLILTGAERVYVANVDRAMDAGLIGAEVLALGGQPVGEAVRCLASYGFGDNDYSRQDDALGNLHNPRLAARCGLTDGRGPLRLTVAGGDGARREVAIASVPRDELQFHDSRPKPSLLASSGEAAFFYRTFAAQDYTYLRFDTMMDRTALIEAAKDFVKPYLLPFARLFVYAATARGHTPRFPAVLARMFAETERLGIHNLVVDLRGNGGGDDRLGKQFLYFLDVPPDLEDFQEFVRISPLYRQQFRIEYKRIKRQYEKKYGRPLPAGGMVRIDDLERPAGGGFFREVEDRGSPMYVPPPRHKFKGRLYVLIDSGTNSAAMDFATLVKDNRLGRLIGTPTGARPSWPTNLSLNRLPNSHLAFSVCTELDIRPDTARNDDPALFPDDLVAYPYPDYLEGRDPQLARALELIAGAARPAPAKR
jgi:hypothetical protein